MRKVPLLALLPPLIFAALAAMFYISMQRANPDELPSQMVGRQAPEVTLTQLGDSAPFTDATLRNGHAKLVNFWASWCVPCRVEAPTLGKIAASGVPIYGVNYKDKPDAALGFLGENGSPYAALGADGDGRMAINWGVYGVPETFVIDGAGKVLLRFPGPLTEESWKSTVEPAFRAAEKG